jgi:transcriptional regulator with XRE-family HTH domain
VIDYDLTNLTAAEELYLWRLRRRATNGRLLGRTGPAQTQAEMAAALGISQQSYSQLELGHAALLTAEQVRALLTQLRVGALRPTLAELCLIARRRSRMMIVDVEAAVGVSRPIFHRLERAADDRIVRFWWYRGFIFPDDRPRIAGGYSGAPVANVLESRVF